MRDTSPIRVRYGKVGNGTKPIPNRHSSRNRPTSPSRTVSPRHHRRTHPRETWKEEPAAHRSQSTAATGAPPASVRHGTLEEIRMSYLLVVRIFPAS
ncbi:hypothetical protein BRADI_5g14805v3 [Brachypodium distachyon]|uniref:Uncharacterized protein n=1 Tax=Brachypodium distachyon TaxID=15368 RepID=A0A2K2CH99_BRADI|nr:hypothetical protein BRADI_5g14805v3 [Brachypodium distachyon]